MRKSSGRVKMGGAKLVHCLSFGFWVKLEVILEMKGEVAMGLQIVSRSSA